MHLLVVCGFEFWFLTFLMNVFCLFVMFDLSLSSWISSIVVVGVKFCSA